MIHKLANGPCTLTVVDILSAEGQFGPQMQIDGEDMHGQDVRVYVSEMTGMRQLARLNLTPETARGVTLTLKQVKKDGKTYVDFAIGAVAAPAADGERVSPSSAQAPAAFKKMTLDELIPLYRQCVIGALTTLGDACEERGIPFDAQAIQSAAATLFIRASK